MNDLYRNTKIICAKWRKRTRIYNHIHTKKAVRQGTQRNLHSANFIYNTCEFCALTVLSRPTPRSMTATAPIVSSSQSLQCRICIANTLCVCLSAKTMLSCMNVVHTYRYRSRYRAARCPLEWLPNSCSTLFCTPGPPSVLSY